MASCSGQPSFPAPATSVEQVRLQNMLWKLEDRLKRLEQERDESVSDMAVDSAGTPRLMQVPPGVPVLPLHEPEEVPCPPGWRVP